MNSEQKLKYSINLVKSKSYSGQKIKTNNQAEIIQIPWILSQYYSQEKM